MARFKIARPTEEVRLKKWGPARVAQLKVFLSNLEQAANRSLASQVAQSPKRKFSEFVPIIPFQDIFGEVEYREIRVRFEPPKGLRNLLFYEYQISRTSVFAQFISYNSPDPTFVFSDLEDNTTFYVRIRVVTTDGLVGPWSDTLSGTTPLAKASGSLDLTQYQWTLSTTTYKEIFRKRIDVIGGKLYYSLQFDARIKDDVGAGNFAYSTIEFRWLENYELGGFKQQGQFFYVTNYRYGGTPGTLSIYDGEVATSGSPLTTTTPFTTKKRGTLFQKFHSVATGDLIISLEARLVNFHTLPNEFQFNPGVTVTNFLAPSLVFVKNFNSFEALV